MHKSITKLLFALVALVAITGCQESTFTCGAGQTAKDGVCIPKTCQEHGYGCPTCNSDETLMYFDDGSGFCKLTSCPESQNWIDINQTSAMCVDKTCQADGYGCPTCNSDETLMYFDDGSGFCKLSACPESQNLVDINQTDAMCVNKTCQADGYGCPTCNADQKLIYNADGSGSCIAKNCRDDLYNCPSCDAYHTLTYLQDGTGYCKQTSCPESQNLVDINQTDAICVNKTCQADGYGCPTCSSNEKLTYGTDGSGICIAKNCRDDGYGCPSCTVYEELHYLADGSGYCPSKPCVYPAINSSWRLDNFVIPYCKVQLKNGEWINVDLGVGSGVDTLEGRSYFITDNALTFNCGDKNNVCPNDANATDQIYALHDSEFTPAILRFELNEAANRVYLREIDYLKGNDQQRISARHHPLLESNSSIQGFARNGSKISGNPNAMDVEAVAKLSSNKGYWISDEYAASLAHVDENGVITKRYVPQGWLFSANYDVNDSLPSELTKRQVGRGIEAIAVDETAQKLYFMSESPLEGDTSIRLYTAALNSDSTAILSVANDHNYTATAGYRVSEMLLLSNNKLLIVEHDGSNTLLFGVDLTTPGAVSKHAITINATLPSKIQGLARDPQNGANRYFFSNDNDFGQNGSANRLIFTDLNTSGF